MALGSNLQGRAGGAYRVPHLTAFDATAKAKAEEALGLATSQLDEFAEAARSLAKVRLSDEDATEFFKTLLKIKSNDDAANANDAPAANSRRLTRLVEAYHTAPGQDVATARGTLWGAVNAITYVTDHLNGRTQDTRMSKAWFGSGARFKRAALKLALAQAA